MCWVPAPLCPAGNTIHGHQHELCLTSQLLGIQTQVKNVLLAPRNPEDAALLEEPAAKTLKRLQENAGLGRNVVLSPRPCIRIRTWLGRKENRTNSQRHNEGVCATMPRTPCAHGRDQTVSLVGTCFNLQSLGFIHRTSRDTRLNMG